jgi:molecular chaperone GrpE
MGQDRRKDSNDDWIELDEPLFDEFGQVSPPASDPIDEPVDAESPGTTNTPTPNSNGTPPDHVDSFESLFDPDAPLSATVERDLRDSRERLLRLAADFDNYKKRAEREKSDHTRFANERLLKDLLPVLDNLTRAIESARKSGEAPAITAGLDLVLQEFLRVIHKSGVEQINAVGAPFDPALHEAIQQVETDEFPPGSVATELVRGYLLSGRVLRPALVTVAVAPEATSPGIEIPDSE